MAYIPLYGYTTFRLLVMDIWIVFITNPVPCVTRQLQKRIFEKKRKEATTDEEIGGPSLQGQGLGNGEQRCYL